MDEQASGPERRTVLRGVLAGGVVLAGGAAVSACGSDEPATTGTSPEATVTDEPSDGTGGNGSDGKDAEVLVATSKVPQGGGVILEDVEIVVTQPVAGEFVAFSSICTHQGCPVSDIANGTINCACHGSQFSVEDGSVVAGPAPSPLPPVEVTVDGKSVVRA